MKVTSKMRKAFFMGLLPVVLIFTPVTHVAAQICVAPPSGLVSWWPGDGNANDIADANPGSLVGNVAFSTGKVGQAFSVDGSDGTPDYIRVTNNLNLEPQNVTVDAWVKAAGSPGGNRYILAKGAQACTAASYALYTGPTGGLFFYVFNSGATFFQSPDAGLGVWDGNWHHVAGTYDANTVRLYVDGSQVGSGTSTPTGFTIEYPLPNDNDLIIGQYTGTCSLPFTGDIDEVEMYNRALSSAEIQAIFNAGPAGKCKTPATQQLLITMIEAVMNLNVNQGISNSFDSKLNVALMVLDDINQNNDVAAINALQAFIDAVEAQRGNQISDADATDLITAAQEIIDLLIG